MLAVCTERSGQNFQLLNRCIQLGFFSNTFEGGEPATYM